MSEVVRLSSAFFYSLPVDDRTTGVRVTLMGDGALVTNDCCDGCIDTKSSGVVMASVDNSSMFSRVESRDVLLSVVVSTPADVV